MPTAKRLYTSSAMDAEYKNTVAGGITRYSSATIDYAVFDAADEEAAITAVKDIAISPYQGMSLTGFSTTERCGKTTWKISANYTYKAAEKTDEDLENESQFSFDTSGGTKHLTHSISTVYSTPGAPNFYQAINYDGKSVQGVDITMPTYSFSESHYFKASKITTTYKNQVMLLTGTVNNAAFRNFAKGEVLFMGASGSRTGTDSDDLWAITFKFACSPNAESLTIGELTIPSKEGWQYLWVKYQDTADDAEENLVSKPIAAYVEQVYKYGDFSALGIGVN